MMLGGWITGQVSGDQLWIVPIIGEVRPWQMVFFVIGLPGLLLALWVRTLIEPERGAMSERPPRVRHRFYHVPASNTAVGHLILENT